ncbi:MAG: hypothetical protein K9M82_08025 [Deltaproteobacteria bacterium]|nr:hypothetical protein [Deltaproteobacteria bacterium]
MKRLMLLTAIFCFLLPGAVSAQSVPEDFLGLPVPQGEEVKRTEDRLEVKSPMTHDEVLSFYKQKLEGMEDIKIRNWSDQSYIEDDSNRPWHSVTIDKEFKDGTKIVIMKDNWTWIIGTLLLRYVGVFVVLLLLLVGMTVSGKIISSRVEKADAKK